MCNLDIATEFGANKLIKTILGLRKWPSYGLNLLQYDYRRFT